LIAGPYFTTNRRICQGLVFSDQGGYNIYVQWIAGLVEEARLPEQTVIGR